MGLNIGIVGATGAVGQKILEVLLERDIPIGKIRLFASEKSEGKVINIDKFNLCVTVEKLTEEVMKEKYDYLLFAGGGSISEKYAPIAADAGNIIIDNSSHFRMKDYIPLVVPEVNAHVLKGYKGIISNPNCSTIQMLVAIAPLHKKYGIKRIVISTYQAVSGSGYKAIEELKNQVEDENYPNKVYPRKIFGNCIPHIDVFNENGFTKEELKMVYETHKILEDDSIEINATAVRIPVYYGHSESIFLEFNEKCDLNEVNQVLNNSRGVKVVDNIKEQLYPTPLDAENTDITYVGRIRKDLYRDNCISMWVVADNLRKGAATNAVQILEELEKLKMEG